MFVTTEIRIPLQDPAAIDRPPQQSLLFPRGDDLKQVLETAERLVRVGWTRGAYAINGEQVQVSYKSKVAISYCVVGAIMRANEEVPVPHLFGEFWRNRRFVNAIKIVSRAIDHSCAHRNYDLRSMKLHREHHLRRIAIEEWNDAAKYNEVLYAFRSAVQSMITHR